ncbi:signal peptidase I [Treponema bryantii]|uniref:signal peptidase I n=1 Tax=Treponema bryantii TaxID=163 RepID=UPI0003B57228|nr:signal peptidase I [Treponema bryantii]
MSNKKELSKEFKKFKLLTIIELTSACIFTLLNLSFHADISLLAFPISVIYLAFTCWFLFKKLYIDTDGSRIYAAIKLNEYLPYLFFITFIIRRAGNTGTPFIVDVFAVISWFVVFVLAYFNSRVLYPAKNAKIVQGWALAPLERKFKGGAKVLFEITDWIDAFFWSIFTVLIFQIFLMQLYEIPSESMVPTFLIKDRVFVSKIDCGPKFPLTEVGLPNFRKYKRGDTIVLRNPHYSMDRKSEVKTVTSQLIYMFSIMTVNLNKDADGELKADPLVKRITGLPGEQLVMQDGTLYRRTADSDEFEPVQLDAKYATWNLNAVNSKLKPYIQHFPFNSDEYQTILDFEESRRNYDLTAAEFQAKELVKQLKKMTAVNKDAGRFTNPSVFEYQLFNNAASLSKQLMMQEGGLEWFEKFITSWIPAKNEIRDYYSESNYRLNVMTKITFGKMIVEFARLNYDKIPENDWSSDKELALVYDEAGILNWYIQSLLDSRNMPVFPANDSEGNPQYIPANCYFMMGDNRFNSLDLRHSYEQKETALTKHDPLSVTYYSMMAPQYINKKYIVGKPVFRFWPLGRLGKV